jgi:membrane protein
MRMRELGRGAWWDVLKRTFKGYSDDSLSDHAAALTYYTVMSIFPAVLALTSILGLIGPSATTPLLSNLTKLAPGTGNSVVGDAIREVTHSRGAAGLALVLGLVGALWSASAYIGAFGRATNAIYGYREGRPFWKLRPLQLLVTLIAVLFLAVVALAIVLSGPVASQAGKVLGVEGAAVTAWNIAKWPVIALAILTLFSFLYYATPNVRQPSFRWLTPGAILAIVLWVAASAGFAVYVANFASYNATYGSLGGVIVFLVWLWISNVAVLLGAELNSELERGREMEAGVPPERTIALEPRDEPG